MWATFLCTVECGVEWWDASLRFDPVDGRSALTGELSADDRALQRLVDPATFARGWNYAHEGAVLSSKWIAKDQHVYGEVAGSGVTPYTAWARLTRSPDGELASFQGNCTCPVHLDCKHAVALTVAALQELSEVAEAAPVPAKPQPWEMPLRGLLRDEDVADDQPKVGLQFEIVESTRSYRTGLASPLRIGMRPVTRGARGGWIRSGISWQTLRTDGGYLRGADRDGLTLLAEITAMDAATRPTYYANPGPLIYLDAMPNRRVWTVLAEARALGLPFVAGPGVNGRIDLLDEAAQVAVELGREDGALVLRTRVTAGSQHPEPDAMLMLGSPPHGIAFWRADDATSLFDDGSLRLAPLADRVDPVLDTLLGMNELRIPAEGEQQFFTRYYPNLEQRVHLVAPDGTVELPTPEPPVLVLSLAYGQDTRLDLSWQWHYALGEAVRRESLWPVANGGRARDLDHETAIVLAVEVAARPVAALLGRGSSRDRLSSSAWLEGLDALRFLSDVLPELTGLPGVQVETHGVVKDYREAAAGPLVEIEAISAPGERDWLDLAVTVTVEGEDVPFDQLFVALASGQEHLLLPSGTWFTLDRPELASLATLIAEARAINDAGPQTARIGRFQADLWEELDQLGVIGEQVSSWRESMAALSQVTRVEQPPLPAGLHAELRPYQAEGFAWLAFLRSHDLGGILADEMGLGKTLQAIALMCHTKDAGETAPYLVVAPTSVVYNWSAECERFAPGLNVRIVTETGRRRAESITEVAAGADVVVTSYALFRLEYDAYADVGWAGLVLDEAQFVKNSKSRAYRCAKLLPAPFKLAITGTPMENNLLELWSLLSITAPGLFPHPAGFEKHYRVPIERDNDRERLAQLRRRVKPLMLRRTKEQVVSDLPPKQEQVVDLPLNPKHRRVYDTHLQRERSKVLGLLGNLEKNRFEIFRSLTLLRQASLDVSLIDPRYHDIPSTKLDALMDLLTEIASEGHRTLVFSQFTRFLGNAKARLDEAGIDYCYLDGSTRRRPEVLESFRSGDAPVFLISLKAGGFGLNLTEADYCILLDPWWNPAAEAQAVDRVHRIGQTRNVMVYRLVAKDTIEEKVMALKERKAALFHNVMADGEVAPGALTAADIRGILE
jgi:superfamily II DNA or RNA helicase